MPIAATAARALVSRGDERLVKAVNQHRFRQNKDSERCLRHNIVPEVKQHSHSSFHTGSHSRGRTRAKTEVPPVRTPLILKDLQKGGKNRCLQSWALSCMSLDSAGRGEPALPAAISAKPLSPQQHQPNQSPKRL